jgi:hypothetical protein
MDLERRSNSCPKRRHFEKLFRICDILALDFDEYEGACVFRVSGLGLSDDYNATTTEHKSIKKSRVLHRNTLRAIK